MTAISTTALDLLDAVVRIDSINPGLDPVGAGDAQIAAHVARWGRSAALRADVLESTAGRPRAAAGIPPCSTDQKVKDRAGHSASHCRSASPR
jgi:hypothetical protein